MPQGPPPQAVDASKPPLDGDAVCAANVERIRETFFEPHEAQTGRRAASPASTRSSVFFPQSEQRYSKRGMGSLRPDSTASAECGLIQMPLADATFGDAPLIGGCKRPPRGGSMRVQDVMTRRVETIDDQASAELAFDSMKVKGCLLYTSDA